MLCLLQMSSLENYTIGPHEETEDFIMMFEKSINFDRADFLESGYIMKEEMYARRMDKEASSSRKGKS